MYGTLSEEREVNVPASKAWKLYGTLELAHIVAESLPDVITKINLIQGDGGPGTILELFFPPGTGAFTSCREKFTVVDDEKRVKIVEVVEGGYLNLGFTLYRIRFEIIDKKGRENQCITRSVVEYELKEEAAASAAIVSTKPLLAIMELAANYLQK